MGNQMNVPTRRVASVKLMRVLNNLSRSSLITKEEAKTIADSYLIGNEKPLNDLRDSQEGIIKNALMEF